jgi:ribosomal protein S9
MTTIVEKTTYHEAVGRRKTSVARARITPTTKQSIVINDKDLDTYFVTEELRSIATDAFTKSKIAQNL